MEKRNCTKLQCILIALAIVSLVEITTAADYKVGGSNGSWDVGTDLKAWASSKKFYPGDTLTFMYQPFHDLLEVSEANFETCSTTNYFSFYTGGMTIISLTSPGSRYFICGVSGHCTAGMKVQIDILSSSAPPPPISSSPPPPASNHSISPTSPPPKQDNTAPPKLSPLYPPKLSPKVSPKLAPRVSPKPSPSKQPAPAPVPAPAPAPLMAPVSTPSTSMAVGIDRILVVIMGTIIMSLVVLV